MGGNQGACIVCDGCGRQESVGRLGSRSNGAKDPRQLVAEGWSIPRAGWLGSRNGPDLCPTCLGGDTGRVLRLRALLADQLAWYAEYTEKERTGEVDSSYVYDMAEEEFSQASRGLFQDILSILSES